MAIAASGSTHAATCSLAATGVAFGTYNPLAATSNDSTGNVSISCSGVSLELVAYSIAMSAGNGTYLARRMVNGASSIEYNLYLDPLYVSVWGDSFLGSLLLSISYVLSLSPTVRQHTVYGRIQAGQTNVLPGLHTDVVTVTVSF